MLQSYLSQRIRNPSMHHSLVKGCLWEDINSLVLLSRSFRQVGSNSPATRNRSCCYKEKVMATKVLLMHLLQAACKRDPPSLGGKNRAMGGSHRQFNSDKSFLSNQASNASPPPEFSILLVNSKNSPGDWTISQLPQ